MQLLKNIQKSAATLGPIGFIPYAPGTFGTAAAFLLVLLFKPGDMVLFMVLLPSILLGTLACDSAEKILGKDSGQIVLDEFCGYLLSVMFLPRNALIYFAAFILFRIFDIIKPPPIKRLEELVPGGAGVMADDLMAALYTNICLQVWLRIISGV